MDLAALNANRSRALLKSNTIAQSQVDTDESQLKTTTTDIANAISAQIRPEDRPRTVHQAGSVSGMINLGQYLNSGTRITVLEAIDTVYVDFTLPQQRLRART